jgi:hypothetical protein
MTIDQDALDVATETLRPLFREPVSYLEQAAREVIAAYLTAAVTARVAALEAALKPFADIAQSIEEHCYDIDDNDETSVATRDLFAARAALKAEAP